MGGSYMFFRNAAANLREKDDSLNTMIGGFIAGGIMGTRCTPPLPLLPPLLPSPLLIWREREGSPHDASGPWIRRWTGRSTRCVRLHWWLADRVDERS